ncbi:hypothetical protein EJ08DRAFT_660719 [Tothia fuscella]|uniref:Uncharacterized protein n=1 Tax=Tothia fuscella TaxID=1048955 RepID=A0A9P4NSC8_9PEZI|nr:hypothetical protein EJ08DRAFT_660719 [Tothia fuscella]
MAQKVDTATPKDYHILRTPAGGIEFHPPRDSDALFDALRVAFPSGKSHLERMVDAVKEFLIHEKEEISTACETPDTDFLVVTRANEDSDSGSGSDHVTKAGFVDGYTQGKKSDIKRMTTVWSSKSGNQYQYRSRRAMTEEERKDYRIKRVIGCTHDVRTLEETPIITVVPRRDAAKATTRHDILEVPESAFMEHTTNLPKDVSLSDVDLGYGTDEAFLGYTTEEGFLDGHLNQLPSWLPTAFYALPDPTLTSLTPVAQDLMPDLDSNEVRWTDIDFSTSLIPISVCATQAPLTELASQQRHCWTAGSETISTPQYEDLFGLNVINASQVRQGFLYPPSTEFLPLDGYLADYEDEAYGSGVEKRAQCNKQIKRKVSNLEK